MAASPAELSDLALLVSRTTPAAGAAAGGAPNPSASIVAVPSPDALTHAIAQRYRLELTATYAGHATLVVVNPLEPKADMSEASKAEYEHRAYGTGNHDPLVNPHAYDLACRVYLAARRSGYSQSILYRCAPLPPSPHPASVTPAAS